MIAGAVIVNPKANTREDSLPAIVWRRKWTVLITFAAFVIVTAAISFALPKVYSTSSTLLVARTSSAQSYDAVQVSQVVARSYADILDSPNIAGLVAQQVDHGATSSSLQSKVAVETVPDTQLMKITASDSDPRQAQLIANAFAKTFIQYQRTRLAPLTNVSVSLADAAPLPKSPDRPKPLIYTAIGAILGLLAGIGLALLRERLDSRLRSPEEIEADFALPVLARIPPRGRAEASRAAYTEAFRVLRTNLQFASPDERPPRLIAITSENEREGKTTVAAQLALVSATTGARVLCVEADLRRPDLQGYFRRDEQTRPLSPGLSSYLVGDLEPEAVMHDTGVPGVKLVPAGPPVPSLSGLLESDRGRQAIGALAAQADMVVLDCPSLRSGADAATLAGRADGVILVVDLERATRQSVRDAIKRLESVRARVLGFALNQDHSAGGATIEPIGGRPRSARAS
jgi:capsular exopolysaccharide synthesis family protein